jgi:hypothetical protein
MSSKIVNWFDGLCGDNYCVEVFINKKGQMTYKSVKLENGFEHGIRKFGKHY